MTPLKNIIQERWTLPPPAEHIQAIIVHLKLDVTAEVMPQEARFAAWDALQAAADADLGESPWQTRQEVGV
jgi:hypothetical protein